jgi:hypothetical protein
MILMVYGTTKRADREEMEERAQFFIKYAAAMAPVTIRQLYYQATVQGIPGITKERESDYKKVARQVLMLRRSGRLPYAHIADATRWVRRPRTFDGWEAALQNTAATYRKNLWADREERVEIWLEKDALAGVVAPITEEYDVPLMVSRGHASETYVWSTVEQYRGSDKLVYIYSLYDFDRSGADAAASLEEKFERFGREAGVPIVYIPLGLDVHQVMDGEIPTRPPKRKTAADRAWPYDFAAELDAVSPDELRQMVRGAIETHLDARELKALKQIEQAERNTLFDFLGLQD